MAEIGNVTVRVDAVITDEQYREAMGAVRAANERMDLLEAENAKLRVLTSCAYGIVDEFMKLNGCPYYDNGMSCSLSDECEETACAEHPDCLLDVLAKTLGIEVDG